MGTIRHHARIDRSPDEVWRVVADAAGISQWFPGIEEAEADAHSRRVTMQGGVALQEEIVTSDDDLRRFQYRVTGGDIPVESHLGTVDVLDAGDGGALVIYSTDVTPDAVAEQMDGAIAGAVKGLKAHLES